MSDRIPPELRAVIDAVGPLADEMENRATDVSKVALIDYQPSRGENPVWLTLPGTVTIFVTRGNSDLLDQLKAAINKRADDVILAITDRLRKQFEKRKPLSLKAAAEQVIAEPVFAEIRYLGASVARSVFVPADVDACVVSLPYNGGAVKKSGLEIVQYVSTAESPRLRALAVRHAPELTDAETAALRELPDAGIGANIGTAAMCYAITGVAIVAAVMGATSFCVGRVLNPHDPVEHLSVGEIKRLGPARTARGLLRARRKALQER